MKTESSRGELYDGQTLNLRVLSDICWWFFLKPLMVQWLSNPMVIGSNPTGRAL
jgi:hypothetical protein